MHREWSIADGPAVLSKHDIGQKHAFTVVRPDGTPWRVLIDIDGIHSTHGRITTFSGRLHYDRQIIAIIGRYDCTKQSGHCSTPATPL